MEAVAIGNLTEDVFADVLKNGAKQVSGTGCMIVPDAYMKLIDEITDWKIEREAARRLEEPNPTTYTEQEALALLGITEADMEAAEDLEIEMENKIPQRGD